MLFVLLLLSSVCVCEGRRVLVVFPVPGESHNILAESLVNTLLDAEYQVTYVTLYPKEPQPNLKCVDVSSVLNETPDKEQTKYAEDISSPQYLLPLGTRFAQRVLKHPDMQELMMDTALVFDAVLVEWFYTGLLSPTAKVIIFKVPQPLYESVGCNLQMPIDLVFSNISWQSLSLVTNPPAIEVSPSSLADRVHQMWFNMYFNVWNYLHIIKVEIPVYEDCYRDAFKVRFRLLINYETMVMNGSLLLINSHPLLDPAVPLPGNVKYIGGHHLSEEESSLPKDLWQAMDSSEAGVIYVNMESDLISSDVRDQVALELKDIFSDLEQTVIWKYDGILVNLPLNVYTLKNSPQHSILSHVNTIAFINHGDMLSILDGTHYGVPLISLPMLEDQVANVKRMVKRGSGIKLDSKNLVSEVKKSVGAILNNTNYRINAKRAGSIFRHRLVSPQQEFLHAVETVIRTHGAVHLRTFIHQNSVLETYNVDIMLLVCMVFWFLTKVAKVIRVHLDTASKDHEKED